ncbi:heme biosynthesis HemY N-terminal domain-containing protein [Paracoccus sediminicola]|uniref:heme biosynthesis HemY N-terminal domain-containing protein n=1 Tax=Paracoccus sediminicola TaxID=3017783 RepID=UPI0022F0C5A5|nr:heme biosynthesis HemY N-terminal domain-containing protein [Paracoccus sediminicola]WBU57214.1 heme biosynthesis protein HemY [Paracoccus sediminicola]
MLLSLLKILLFFAVILAVALGLNALSATSEGVRVVLAGTEYTLGPIQAVVALLILLVAVWLLFKLLGIAWAFLRFVMGDETAINRYFARSRREKGLEALSQGLLAVAAGDAKEAQSQAAKANKYLDDKRATRLLAAQAAEVAGDDSQAETVYREMLEDDRTRFVGVRGLLKQKLSAGDTETALQLAQKAYALRPRHTETQNTLLELTTKQGDWKGARGILKDKRRQGDLPKDVHIRRDAVLALQEARNVLAGGTSVSAREAAISAAKASPDLIPAVVLAARSYMAQKDPRNAERLLEKAWSVNPHPDLAATFAAIKPDETPNQRLRRFESLMKKNADHEETRLLRAELLLANEDFPGARRALGDLAETHPTTRTLSIMAAVERGEGGDDAAVRAWLVKAMNASRGPQWVCDKCEHVMDEWAPICENCGGFDTLSWREPAQKRGTSVATSGAELLPLLVGRPSDRDEPETTPGDNAQPVNETESVPEAAQANGAASGSVVADVAPGIVPRESDFVNEPAVTQAKQAPAPKIVPASESPTPAHAKPTPARDETTVTTRTPVDGRDAEPLHEPVRPDVEPPEDASLPPAREADRSSRLVLDADNPPRPDVEPIDKADKPR